MVAGFYRSASAFMNLLKAALKIVAEYYPGRLCKAFVIDPPSLFAYLWKVKQFKILICLILVVYHVLCSQCQLNPNSLVWSNSVMLCLYCCAFYFYHYACLFDHQPSWTTCSCLLAGPPTILYPNQVHIKLYTFQTK